MFNEIKKYVIGFFVLCGGIFFAFLSGKSTGKKNEKLKGVKKQSKKVSDLLKDKKKNVKQIKKTKYKKKNIGSKEAADYLKKFATKGKKK